MSDKTKYTIKAIIDMWKQAADIKDVGEKRYARFMFLGDLQAYLKSCKPEFIKEVIETLSKLCHGNIYQYNQLVFDEVINLLDKIPLVCPSHGLFHLRILDHLLPPNGTSYPVGCPHCLHELVQAISDTEHVLMNNAIVIANLELKHGSSFDFNNMEPYMCPHCAGITDTKVASPVSVTCEQIAPDTSPINLIFDEVHAKSKELYGGNHDINTIGYGEEHGLVYQCFKCGAEISQSVSSYISGKGCPTCDQESDHLITLGEALRRAKAVHYDHKWVFAVREDADQNYYCNICGGDMFNETHIPVDVEGSVIEK